MELGWCDTGNVARQLAGAGIESRHWWARGCHRQHAFAACPRTSLEATEYLAGHTLALPFHLRFGPAELNRIVTSVAASLAGDDASPGERAAAQAG